MRKVLFSMLIMGLSFKTVTAQTVKIDSEKLLGYYETQRYADAAYTSRGCILVIHRM